MTTYMTNCQHIYMEPARPGSSLLAELPRTRGKEAGARSAGRVSIRPDRPKAHRRMPPSGTGSRGLLPQRGRPGGPPRQIPAQTAPKGRGGSNRSSGRRRWQAAPCTSGADGKPEKAAGPGRRALQVRESGSPWRRCRLSRLSKRLSEWTKRGHCDCVAHVCVRARGQMRVRLLRLSDAAGGLRV